ncbi:MAG TPA: hypothetical protein VFG42_05770 [Baekduia sp.]|uniref:hypothetical protein n=1 Tax=Baekduia sp. TaxID=2600305 RepID=UPI002D7A28B7|nr:hypothetical protein [Baekduia sp.]HET6506275.1 hypothetical protein [Baekduia sp.]
MAQTKRKRRTKHRGNAAGVVEVRGRTGKQVNPTSGSKGKGAVRTDRLDRPPTWRSAANRSAIATVLFVLVIALLQKNVAAAVAIGLVMFFVYTALGFYTDKWIYERRQAKKRAGKL